MVSANAKAERPNNGLQESESVNQTDSPSNNAGGDDLKVLSSDLLGKSSKEQSIKDLGASWLCLAKTALEATKNLHELELLISRPQSNQERVEQ